MEFLNFEGKTKSVRISDPKTTLTAEIVEEAMETFNDLRVFNSISLDAPSTIKGAKTIQTITSDFGIIVS